MKLFEDILQVIQWRKECTCGEMIQSIYANKNFLQFNQDLAQIDTDYICDKVNAFFVSLGSNLRVTVDQNFTIFYPSFS